MGTYIYTLRADHEKLKINGVKEKVHYFSYAYKPYWGYFNEEPRSIKMKMARWDKYWSSHDLPKFAMCCDREDFEKAFTKKEEDFINVYTNLRSWQWTDTLDFPGTLYGGIHIVNGRSYFLNAIDFNKELERRYEANRAKHVIPQLIEKQPV